MNDDFIPQIKPGGERTDNKISIPGRQKGFAGPLMKKVRKERNQIKQTDVADKGKMRVLKPSGRKYLFIKIILGIFIALAVFGVLFFNIYSKSRKVVTSAKSVEETLKLGDLQKAKEELKILKSNLVLLQSSYKTVSWMKFIPFLGGYIADGMHGINAGVYGADLAEILLLTIEPYADLLGFNGNSANIDGEKTAADRVDFIVSSLPSILPKLDEISNKAEQVKVEVDNINPNRYPKEIAGKKVREKIETAIDAIDTGAKLVGSGKPLLENAPYLLGLDSPRTYLILFQNDKELRPTGGFMTAYSIMKVDKGKFEPVTSNDIYNLDAKYKPVIDAPKPLVDYIKGPYILSKKLRLRDMNWSPDFSVSMKLFTEEIKNLGIDDIDGVIAVDTQLLVNLLDAIGPIGVPGFGNFSTQIVAECNCPQVIYELESFADVEGPIVWDPNTGKIVYRPPNSDNRKKIIGPLMNSIMSNSLGQPKEKIPALFEAGFTSLMEKHVLFYLFESKPQNAVKDFGLGGTVANYQGDYLYINDANLGGRKSNLYATQEINEEINILSGGSVEKILTITYNNPEKHDGWLNSILPNWIRIYVPKGSELIAFEGIEDKQTPYEEFDKTVYAGFFELRPQGVVKVTVKYKLPFKVKDVYKYYIQKQPGKDNPLYTVKIGKIQEEFLLNTDKEFKFRI